MNDQRENFGPFGEDYHVGICAGSRTRWAQRVGAQVGRLAETAGTKFDSAVDHMGETAQSVKQSLQAMSDEGWDGMKKKAEDYTPEGAVECSFVSRRSWHLSGMGDTESGVTPCPKIPLPCSPFPDCLNCWKGFTIPSLPS